MALYAQFTDYPSAERRLDRESRLLEDNRYQPAVQVVENAEGHDTAHQAASCDAAVAFLERRDVPGEEDTEDPRMIFGITGEQEADPQPSERVVTYEPLPVNAILGKQTRWVLAAPDRIESFIIERPQTTKRCGIDGYEVLVRGPVLVAAQIALLQRMVLDPRAYYDGRPVFKRWPSVPECAFRLHRGERKLDLLLDLHNPGWEFYCGRECYSGWNWAGRRMVVLVKALFPHQASPCPRSIWKRGAMKRLAKAARPRSST
jgi:hypothetical protein